jgi:hypothetical protein
MRVTAVIASHRFRVRVTTWTASHRFHVTEQGHTGARQRAVRGNGRARQRVARAREPKLETTAELQLGDGAARERRHPELGRRAQGERAGAPSSGGVLEVLDSGGIPVDGRTEGDGERYSG